MTAWELGSLERLLPHVSYLDISNKHVVDCGAVQLALETEDMMPGLQPKMIHCILLELVSLGAEDPAFQHMHSVARTIESYHGVF